MTKQFYRDHFSKNIAEANAKQKQKQASVNTEMNFVGCTDEIYFSHN